MQYLNGDKCYGDNGVFKQRRSLRLWLICDNDSDNVPDDEVRGGEREAATPAPRGTARRVKRER